MEGEKWIENMVMYGARWDEGSSNLSRLSQDVMIGGVEEAQRELLRARVQVPLPAFLRVLGPAFAKS